MSVILIYRVKLMTSTSNPNVQGTVGDPKPARTSPYDGTEPVILLRPEDMRACLNHQLPMHSHIDLEIYSDNNEW